MEEARDEQRIRDEMKAMALAEGVPVPAAEGEQEAADPSNGPG